MRAAKKSADDGVYFEPTRLALSKWLKVWLKEYVEPSVKPLTYLSYASQCEIHIIPALGKVKLNTLNTTQIQKSYNDLTKEKGLSPKTIKNIHGVVHKALVKAVELRYIGFNPADACTLPYYEKKEIHPFEQEDIKAFLKEIDFGEPLKDLFMVTLFTGLREGEVCGLSWDTVDFDHGTITIR